MEMTNIKQVILSWYDDINVISGIIYLTILYHFHTLDIQLQSEFVTDAFDNTIRKMGQINFGFFMNECSCNRYTDCLLPVEKA